MAAKVPRVYIERRLCAGAEFALTEGARHHLFRVLRMRAGDRVRFFNHEGREFLCRLQAAPRRAPAVLCEREIEAPPEPASSICLYLALCKAEHMGFAIQKATELGVASIQPLVTARAAPMRAASRHAHWRGVIVAACEQSGRAVLPTLAAPIALSALAPVGAVEPAFVLHPGAATGLAPPSATSPAPQRAHLLVGSEGGLRDEEIRLVQEAGFQAVALGPRTLRVETAVTVGVGLLQYWYGGLSPAPGGASTS